MDVRYDLIACFVVRPGPGPGAFELLQLRRAPGQFMAGSWQTVLGRIEPGERAVTAALRELKEETGLTPQEFYQLDTVNIFYVAARDAIWHCPGFCAMVSRDAAVVLNHEHDDLRWIDRFVVIEHFMWPGEHIQLRELCSAILDDGPAKPHMRLKV